MGKIREFVEKFRLPLVAAIFWVGINTLDILSSIHMPDGFGEKNPFTRTPDYAFMLSRGIGVKFIALSMFAVIGVALYQGFKAIDERIGKTAASLPFFYFGIDNFLNAVVPNFLIHLGWYQS